MMTGLQNMQDFFFGAGVKFETVTAKDFIGSDICTSEHDGEITWDTAIKLENGIGYYEFYCMFYFLDGKYQGHGVWE